MIIKKLTITFLITILVFRAIFPAVVLADDSPTPTPDQTDQSQSTPAPTDNPAPTDSPSVTPSPTDSPTVSPTDPTDSPTITPDPSESPTDSPTPTPDDSSVSPDPTATDSATGDPTNDATVDNTVDSDGNSGDNTIATPSANPTDATSSASINTGDSVSETDVNNSINSTTDDNSSVYYQTINIVDDQTGDLDLSGATNIINDLIKNQDLTNNTINVSVVSNDAYVINSVSSTADSGDNTSAGGDITTGNAYSILSILNQVNMTVVNSHIHIITVNIFGNLNGNIILPVLDNSSTCATCGIIQNIQNSATVINDLSSTADSGDNSSEGSATIDTGDATSYVNLLNIINANYDNVDAENLAINLFGDWSGNFLGFTNDSPNITNGSLLDSNLSSLDSGNCTGCSFSLDADNNAYLENDLSSTANSGNNNGTGNINTGKAISIVSLLNFINTNFINSNSFFGFINIFGKLNGNIGRADLFAPTSNTNDSNVVADSSSDSSQEEVGGQFDVSTSNNVAAYVLPGDTVTFYVNVKNIGSGKIYNAKLYLSLVKDGVNMGGGEFDLGDIEAGKRVYVTTGLVLSSQIVGGLYQGQAYVTGDTGNGSIDGVSNSNFNVLGNSYGYYQSTNIKPGSLGVTKVLASTNNPTSTAPKSISQDTNYISLFILIFALYFLLEKINKDRQLLIINRKSTKKRKSKLN